MSKVVIYTSPTCPYCKKAKSYMNEKGVDFHERDITKDPSARKTLASRGYRSVPVIDIDGEYILGFDEGKIDQALAQ